MSPAVVLAMVAGLGARVGRVLIVGCQPALVDEGIGLSPVVAATVETGVDTPTGGRVADCRRGPTC